MKENKFFIIAIIVYYVVQYVVYLLPIPIVYKNFIFGFNGLLLIGVSYFLAAKKIKNKFGR